MENGKHLSEFVAESVDGNPYLPDGYYRCLIGQYPYMITYGTGKFLHELAKHPKVQEMCKMVDQQTSKEV